MQSKFISVQAEALKVSLGINIAKTKTMRTNTKNSDRFHICQQHLEEVKSFCYLGSILTTFGDLSADIKSRINASNQTFGLECHLAVIRNIYQHKAENLQRLCQVHTSLRMRIMACNNKRCELRSITCQPLPASLLENMLAGNDLRPDQRIPGGGKLTKNDI